MKFESVPEAAPRSGVDTGANQDDAISFPLRRRGAAAAQRGNAKLDRIAFAGRGAVEDVAGDARAVFRKCASERAAIPARSRIFGETTTTLSVHKFAIPQPGMERERCHSVAP
jgi:hypothetical protein